jgi:hypothetical protein
VLVSGIDVKKIARACRNLNYMRSNALP